MWRRDSEENETLVEMRYRLDEREWRFYQSYKDRD